MIMAFSKRPCYKASSQTTYDENILIATMDHSHQLQKIPLEQKLPCSSQMLILSQVQTYHSPITVQPDKTI